MIAGVLTAGELALLRTRPQRTQLYLAIPTYHTVYTARVNGTPASNDDVVSIAFDGGAGLLTDVKSNMMLLVGSTAGAWDIGIARIRTDPGLGDTSFNIGITSEIDWLDDQFLTVIDNYGLWPRHPYINPATSVLYMDYAFAYTNQHQYGAPVIIMGSHAVLELAGATVTTNFDAVDSYSCIGGVPAGGYTYAWTCAGAVVATPAASDTDITFNAAGTYTVRLSVTADYGGGNTATSLAVRYVIVYSAASPLNTSFELDSCQGDYDSGNWSYRITMRDNATETDIMDRSLCLLVATDWYGTTQQSIGPLVGRENVVCVGWVDGESIERSNDKSSVSFNVEGPAFWLGVQEGFPTGVDDTNVAPSDWAHIQELTPRKGIFTFLHWRSTATNVMDCYITDDDHRLATTYTPAGSLLEQLRSIAERVNAKAACDRYGRLFVEIDTQFITPASRTFPVVQTLSDRDWRDDISMNRRTVSDIGQVDLSGVFYSGDLTTSVAIFSLSPGHYPKHYGRKNKVERIALDDQAEANLLAGLWLGYLNNEYPTIDTPMSSCYRAVDIAPRMFVQMSLAAGDTPRGLSFTNKKLIPRRVSFDMNPSESLLLTDITFEAETFASDAVTGDPPITPPDPPDVVIVPPPPVLPPDPELADIVAVWNVSQLGVSYDFYTAAVPAWSSITSGDLLVVNNPDIGDFINFALSPTATAWLLTYKGETADQLLNNGVWYCPDVTAATPSWTLILSWTAYRALGYTGAAHALSVDDNSVFYIQIENTEDYAYGTNGVNFVSPVIPGLIPTRNTYNSIGYVAGVAGVRGTHTNAHKAVITMNNGANSLVLWSSIIAWMPCIAGNHVISQNWADYGILTHYTDSAILNGSVLTAIYGDAADGADWRVGIRSDGTNVLTIRFSDTALMNLAVAVATPLTAFGAGRTGAGFCLGLAGYGEIIWTARDNILTERFISMRSTGGAWTDKTGNWVASIGNWPGYASGVSPVVVMPGPWTVQLNVG